MNTIAPNQTIEAPTPFEFEKTVDVNLLVAWMRKNWYKSLYWSTFYVFLILSLQRIMKYRNALELKTPLIIWNTALAIFSIAGTLRTLPTFIQVIRELGFTYSVCVIKPLLINIQPTIFWSWLFACSKIVEFGDTVFIILRKRKLIFLHWYHHVVTLILCWYTSSLLVSVIHWYMVMNYTVHSLMYSYYALSTIGIKVPRIVAMFITFMQLSQMMIGAFVSGWAIWKKWKGCYCEFPNDAIMVSLLTYLSYVYLFSRLFYYSYIAKTKNKFKKL